MISILIGLAGFVLSGVGIWFKYLRPKPNVEAAVNAEVAVATTDELKAANAEHADGSTVSDELKGGTF